MPGIRVRRGSIVYVNDNTRNNRRCYGWIERTEFDFSNRKHPATFHVRFPSDDEAPNGMTSLALDPTEVFPVVSVPKSKRSLLGLK